jgi:O-antigen/teichoic acid export membrane protein
MTAPYAASGAVPASHRVARNSVLYFSSLGIPAVAALLLVPVTVRALGPSRFGLLALGWTVAETTGMFDFGLGKATVRFVADATGKGSERLREIIHASVYTQTTMGAIAGLLLFLFAPLLVHRVFTLAPGSAAEAIAMFRVLALHLPVLLCIAALRAALEGAQRFDISTPLRIPSSLASVAVPAIAAPMGASLGTIMWLLLAVRVLLVLITAYAVRRVLLRDRWSVPSGFGTLREMLGYSGWVAVSAAVGPVLANFDRFTVGSVVGTIGLGYYSGAAEGANRFLLIPVTAFSAMLPALAAADATDGRARSLAVTHAARRQLSALFFPLCLALFVFGPVLLGLWLGPAFAQAAGLAFRILSAGIFLTGLAVLPLALLYGAGRPDLPAKINVFQVAVQIPLTMILVRRWGITGAALAVAIRCAEDFILYEWASRRAAGRYLATVDERSRDVRLLISGFALAIAFLAGMAVLPESGAAAAGVAVVSVAAYAWMCWSRVLSASERRAWTRMLLPARGA